MIRKYILGVTAIIVAACSDGSIETGASDVGPRDTDTRLGNVYIAPDPTHAELIANIEGGAESLYIRASEGGVNCDAVSIITSEGEALVVYSGQIAEEDVVRTPLPDDSGDFTRIRFECSADDPLRARLDIAVEAST